MERFMKCPISMNLAFPAHRLGKKTLKNGSRNRVPGGKHRFAENSRKPRAQRTSDFQNAHFS